MIKILCLVWVSVFSSLFCPLKSASSGVTFNSLAEYTFENPSFAVLNPYRARGLKPVSIYVQVENTKEQFHREKGHRIVKSVCDWKEAYKTSISSPLKPPTAATPYSLTIRQQSFPKYRIVHYFRAWSSANVQKVNLDNQVSSIKDIILGQLSFFYSDVCSIRILGLSDSVSCRSSSFLSGTQSTPQKNKASQSNNNAAISSISHVDLSFMVSDLVLTVFAIMVLPLTYIGGYGLTILTGGTDKRSVLRGVLCLVLRVLIFGALLWKLYTV